MLNFKREVLVLEWIISSANLMTYDHLFLDIGSFCLLLVVEGICVYHGDQFFRF